MEATHAKHRGCPECPHCGQCPKCSLAVEAELDRLLSLETRRLKEAERG